MSVKIIGVEEGSPAQRAGIKSDFVLVRIGDHEIMDVLDYRFYQNEEELTLFLVNKSDEKYSVFIKKEEYEEIGLLFDTYLMDSQHSCKNNCLFCFIDQLPPNMRDSLYFKDDDSRMSFLFGNYITLTNITEHEVERIIKMHISPINISVHTTDPELRVRMMKNRFAGDALSVIWRLCDANISINCQLVLCPGYNDGDALRKTLSDLCERESIKSIASVPVGLTKFRRGLSALVPFDKVGAAQTIDIIDEFSQLCLERYGERRCYAADEFYLIAEREIPSADFYGEFAQLENGVGLWSMLLEESRKALDTTKKPFFTRKISIVTGVAAQPLISNIVDIANNRWHNLKCNVYAIKNEFFGERINVAGLITGGDIITQLKGKNLGRELLIPAVMLRSQRDVFLDDVTLEQVQQELKVKVKIVENDGYDLISALAGHD